MKFNRLIPELSVADFAESLKFYTGLGFTIEYRREESKFAMLSFQGSQLMIEEVNERWSTGPLERPFGRGINLQITVEKLEPVLEALKDYPLFQEPRVRWFRQDDTLLGNKEFLVQDPDGYLLRFVEDLGTKPA